MIHYHVWFNLKPGISEEDGLEVVRRYLAQLSIEGESTAFQLLRNIGRPPRSKLLTYHALVEFSDSDALGAAMKKQTERGIHSGGHGQIVDAVCDFHVEIFAHITAFQEEETHYACEI